MDINWYLSDWDLFKSYTIYADDYFIKTKRNIFCIKYMSITKYLQRDLII